MFILLTIISKIFCILPRPFAYFFSYVFGALFFLLNIFRISICKKNIEILLGKEIAESQGLKIILNMYIHFSKFIADFFRIPVYLKKMPENFIEIEGKENFENALKKDKGLFFILGHVGNWEFLGLAFSILGISKGKVIVKNIRNQQIIRFVNNFREKANLEPVLNKNSTPKVIRWIKNKSFIGFVIDQNMSEEFGEFVDFGSKKACTLKAPAVLAKRYKIPVLGVSLVRKKDNNYKLIISPEIKVVDTGNKNCDIITNTQAFSDHLYNTIKIYPEQWIWLHRRFKLQPEGSSKVY